MINVLTIGTDRKLFEDGSAILSRQIEYAKKMKELHIIVFSLRKDKLTEKKIHNVYIYPTDSSSRIGYIFDAVKIGKKILKKNDFVITTQDPFETGLVGYLLKRKFNLPLQLQIHTDFLSSYFKNSLLNYIRVILATFLIPKADGFRVVSSVIADSIQKTFPNIRNVDMLPIFVDIDKFERTLPTKDIRAEFLHCTHLVLMSSRLTEEKSIDTAFLSLQNIIGLFPHVGLILVGDGPQRKKLEALANSLGLSLNIFFVGWQDNLISYYKNADIFLLTSEYEGYGMTLVEAGASGCPIVTTEVGLAKTTLFQNGVNSFVCPVSDVECITKHILELLDDQSKRELFKKRMQDSIRGTALPKDQYIPQYIGLLEKLLPEAQTNH